MDDVHPNNWELTALLLYSPPCLLIERVYWQLDSTTFKALPEIPRDSPSQQQSSKWLCSLEGKYSSPSLTIWKPKCTRGSMTGHWHSQRGQRERARWEFSPKGLKLPCMYKAPVLLWEGQTHFPTSFITLQIFINHRSKARPIDPHSIAEETSMWIIKQSKKTSEKIFCYCEASLCSIGQIWTTLDHFLSAQPSEEPECDFPHQTHQQ